MTAPRICVSLGADATSQLVRWAAHPEVADADLVEVRLDTLRPMPAAEDVARVLQLFGRPVIATCRRAEEGGLWHGDEATRLRLLVAALDAGAAFVDVETEAGFADDLVALARDRVVLSRHWQEAPAQDALDACVRRIVASRPAAAKLVVAVEQAGQAVPVLRAGEQLRAAGLATAAFGMGTEGAGSRLLAVASGDAWTYTRLADPGAATAQGQWSVDRLRHQLAIGRWRPEFSRYGVVGHPLRQSLSPAVFNAAFNAEGRTAMYLPLPGSSFAEVLEVATAAGLAGLSVTMPFKAEAWALAVERTSQARRAGVANTLRWEEGRWVAHNTDGEGLIAALTPHLTLSGARAAILGAGGAARAAAVALRDAGAGVTLYGRRPERAAELGEAVGVAAARLDRFPVENADLVINATPVGMGSTTETPVPTARLGGSEVVLDMVYRPVQTAFLRQARARGCATVSGLEMFLAQAAAQYVWWFGRSPAANTLRQAAMEQLHAEGGEHE